MKEEFYGIEMNKTQNKILKLLLKEKYAISGFIISKKINKSWYYTLHLIRDLKHRGILQKKGEGYILNKGIKKDILKKIK